MSIEEIDAAFDRMQKFEKEQQAEIIRYFDRLHDKLLAYQLFFLAGYISLVAIEKISISPWWLLIPIGCISRLIYIDYAMMERSRKLSQFTSLDEAERDQALIMINVINRVSLEVILETILITILFAYFAICNFR